MIHPDPIPASTASHLASRAAKEEALDETYDSLALELMNALQTNPEDVVHPLDVMYPVTAAGVLLDGVCHIQHGDAIKRVLCELVMDAYRAGDPRALWAVDTIVHEHAEYHAAEIAGDYLDSLPDGERDGDERPDDSDDASCHGE